jgi:hypothetical protein
MKQSFGSSLEARCENEQPSLLFPNRCYRPQQPPSLQRLDGQVSRGEAAIQVFEMDAGSSACAAVGSIGAVGRQCADYLPLSRKWR